MEHLEAQEQVLESGLVLLALATDPEELDLVVQVLAMDPEELDLVVLVLVSDQVVLVQALDLVE